MSCQRILQAFIFLIQANLLVLAQYDYNCLDNVNSFSSPTYRNNLNTALSSSSTNIDSKGFYNASVGQGTDRVNTIALCRGDVQLSTCRECVQHAAAALQNSCPNQKKAICWFDHCMLRYSNETIYGVLTTYPRACGQTLPNRRLLQAVTSPNQFKQNLRNLTDSLRRQAAYGGSVKKFAAGNIAAPDSQTIYSLVQCTPDLTPQDCNSCLVDAATNLSRYCDKKTEGKLFFPSCHLRYATYLFYSDTGLHVPVPAPMPVIEPAILSRSGKDDDNTTRTVIIIVVSVALCVILAVLVVILLRKKTKKKPKENLEIVKDISTIESLQYAFSTIRAATSNFSDEIKLGQGGFGAVYKGKLSNGQEIAVKRSSKKSRQSDLQFKNEVLLLANLQHKNLVRLLGFSLAGIEKLLIYEFFPNGSLDLFIFDPIKQSFLDWGRRYDIICGIARGMLYLHEGSALRIIHRDLKASNVLLDKEMIPKIADFGTARLFGEDETHGNTSRIVGTFGYMAPEYGKYGQFSVKSDVFSFGVLVLEIISGQKNNVFRPGENGKHLLSFAWKHWREGTTENIVDPFLRSGSGSMSDILRCIHIGLLCVQAIAADRPRMASIVLMLNNSSATLADPSEPAFLFPSGSKSDDSLIREFNSRDLEWGNSSNSNTAAQSDHSSRNDASITELYPR